MTIYLKEIDGNEHIFCCGKDLGKLKLQEAYWCIECKNLIFAYRPKQRKILEFIQ